MQTLEFVVSQREIEDLNALAEQVARSRGSLTREAVRNACTGYWFVTSGGVPADPEAAHEPVDGVLLSVDLRDREIAQLDRLAASENCSRPTMLRRCVRHLLAHGAAVTPGSNSAAGDKARRLRSRTVNKAGAFAWHWALIAVGAAIFYLVVLWMNRG